MTSRAGSSQAAVESGVQRRRVLGDLDLAQPGEVAAERHLVVVDDLVERGESRHGDRAAAAHEAVDDAAGPALQHDDVGVEHERAQLGLRDEHTRVDTGRRTRAAVLHDDARALGGARDPLLDPADEPVEEVVVGADGDQHLQPGAHHTGPTTTASG